MRSTARKARSTKATSPPAKEETIALNEDGFRVIAVAYKQIDNLKAAYSVADECDLTLLGYIAFLDPPKDTARAAIAALAEKGVQVKILTGDNDIVRSRPPSPPITSSPSMSVAR